MANEPAHKIQLLLIIPKHIYRSIVMIKALPLSVSQFGHLVNI